jgi:tetratricopeptide (TPR) repeat protein
MLPAAEANQLSRGLDPFNQNAYTRAEQEFRELATENPNSAEAHYYLGITSIKLENYEQAVGALKKAKRLDPTLPAVHLNLGIAYYRSQRYQSAESELRQASKAGDDNGSTHLFLGLAQQGAKRHADSIHSFEQAMKADRELKQPALYNIGYANHHLKKTPAARKALQQAIAVDPDSDTAGYARTLLETVEAAPEKPLTFTASVGIQYDDNVTTAEQDVTSGEEDFAAVLDLSATYKLPVEAELELEAGYDFSQTVYDSLSEFNIQSHILSLGMEKELGDSSLGLGYRYTRSFLDGDDFLQIHSIEPSLGRSLQSDLYLHLAYGFHDKTFFNDSDRDGSGYALSLDSYSFFDQQKSHFKIGYRFEKENTDGPEYDYLGHYVNTGISTPIELVSRGKLDLGYQYFTKDYAHETASIGKERGDKRHTANIKLTNHLGKYLFTNLEYEYMDSDSNLASSDFSQNVFTLSLGGSWAIRHQAVPALGLGAV